MPGSVRKRTFCGMDMCGLGCDVEICPHCEFESKRFCEGGEMEYPDGSGRACPNWNKRLDIIGGKTEVESEENRRFLAQFR